MGFVLWITHPMIDAMQVLNTIKELGPISAYDISVILCMQRRTVERHIQKLYKDKRIHIAARERGNLRGGAPHRLWAHGRQPDAPTVTKAEVSARQRQKNRLKHAVMQQGHNPFAQLIIYTTT